MDTQEALTHIAEYDAAMELPQSGLLGISAALADPPARNIELASQELQKCIDRCQVALRAMKDDGEAARGAVFLYSALLRVFRAPDDRKAFAARIDSLQERLSRILDDVEKTALIAVDAESIRAELRDLTDRIRNAIPKDTYLSSLAGTIAPLP